MHRMCWLGNVLVALSLAAVAKAGEIPLTSGAMARRVDERINARLEAAKIPPGDLADDAAFHRRATLDLTGRIPRVSETRAFLAASQPDRRGALIESLLKKPSHATHLTNTWRRFLLPDDQDVLRVAGTQGFEFWLREQFVRNRPYDEVARELVLAKGSPQEGAALFYAALEFKPEELAATTSRALLGVQIQCAQCHDHPLDKWKQDEFWGYAAFFARLRTGTGIAGPAGALIALEDSDQGEVQHPLTKAIVAPRYLQGEVAPADPKLTRRQQLATWLTAPENPFFAKAAVNRAWALMFGRGLVEPVDDLGEHNPPSHPELLQDLADYFVATKYDLRNLLRVLANTDAYQRTSEVRDGETPPPPELFAKMALKSLTAEQLYDSLKVATAMRDRPAAEMTGPAGFNVDMARLAFLEKFRAPSGSAAEFHGGIPQALTLMNGPMLATAADVQTSDLLVSLQAPFFSDEERVEILFYAVLSRPPYAEERAKFVSHLESKLTDDRRRKALADGLWALLNSGEFALNH